MSLTSRLLAAFSAAVTLAPLGFLAAAAATGRPAAMLAAWAAFTYLLPPLLARMLLRNCGGPREQCDLAAPGFSPWYGLHLLQRPFLALPVLEELLRSVPGAYSAWLRLWGSKVGRGVFWSPGVRVLDRQALDVGDRALIGFEVILSSHVVFGRQGRRLLICEPVRVGAGAIVGARALLGPGTRIEDGGVVPAAAILPSGAAFGRAGKCDAS